jgi:uncharacterized membrane protein YhaH (DUF805 family)
MNYDTLFVSPAGRTARGAFIGALITLLAALAFYYFLVPGRNSQWVQLVLLYPGVVLHARRLHDMGRAAWPLVVPAALIIAMAWLYLFVPESGIKGIVAVAALIVCAGFIVWGLIGKSQAEANPFGAPAD